MSPTLNPTEYTDEKFEDKSENFISRESISKIDYAKSPNNFLIKRIIALPGERIVPLGINKVEK